MTLYSQVGDFGDSRGRAPIAVTVTKQRVIRTSRIATLFATLELLTVGSLVLFAAFSSILGLEYRVVEYDSASLPAAAGSLVVTQRVGSGLSDLDPFAGIFSHSGDQNTAANTSVPYATSGRLPTATPALDVHTIAVIPGLGDAIYANVQWATFALITLFSAGLLFQYSSATVRRPVALRRQKTASENH
jgi:hypothetical protein